MKRLLLLITLCLSVYTLQAQDATPAKGPGRPSVGRYSRDYIMMSITYNGWQGAPDSIHNGGFSRGFNFALMYDFPLKTGSHFSFAPGLGISTSNIFFKDQKVAVAMPSTTLNFPSDTAYKHYKLATAYLEIPLEFRYRQYTNNANRGLKAGIGLKFGAMVSAHTKGKIIANGSKEIDKVSDKRFFNPWRVAGMARVGWGNFSLIGTYTFTSLLKTGAGPTINPYSIGLCISGL